MPTEFPPLRVDNNPLPNNEESPAGNSMLGKYYTTISLYDYKRPSAFDSKKNFENTTNVIFLPLPIQLFDRTGASYSGVEMGSIGNFLDGDYVGGTASATMKGASNVLDTVRKSVGSLVPDFVDKALPSMPSPTLVSTAIEQELGFVANPNPTLKFNGSVLRDFNYTWYLSPKNESESEKISKIITRLKAATLPGNRLSGSFALLDIPKLAQINFFPWDSGGTDNRWGWSNRSIIRMKRCHLENITVNYNPANIPAFFRDSSAVVIELSISLKEVEYMLSGDWTGNGDTGKLNLQEEILGKIRQAGSSVSDILEQAQAQQIERRNSDVLNSE